MAATACSLKALKYSGVAYNFRLFLSLFGWGFFYNLFDCLHGLFLAVTEQLLICEHNVIIINRNDGLKLGN